MKVPISRQQFVLFLNEEYGNIEERVETEDPKKIKVLTGYYAFKFFSRYEGFVCEKNIATLVRSSPIALSPTFFFGGTLYSIPEYQEEFSGDSRFIELVKSAGCSKIIRASNCYFYPYSSRDEIL